MTDFTSQLDGVFIGAMIGAVTSLMFGGLKIPGTEEAGRIRRIVLTICYVLLAGYFARFAVYAQEPYQGFFVGLIQDVFLRKARTGARKWAKFLTDEDVEAGRSEFP